MRSRNLVLVSCLVLFGAAAVATPADALAGWFDQARTMQRYRETNHLRYVPTPAEVAQGREISEFLSARESALAHGATPSEFQNAWNAEHPGSVAQVSGAPDSTVGNTVESPAAET